MQVVLSSHWIWGKFPQSYAKEYELRPITKFEYGCSKAVVNISLIYLTLHIVHHQYFLSVMWKNKQQNTENIDLHLESFNNFN